MRASAVLSDAQDPLPSAVELGKRRFSRGLLVAIDRSLRIRVTERIRSCEDLRKAIGGIKTTSGSTVEASESLLKENGGSRVSDPEISNYKSHSQEVKSANISDTQRKSTAVLFSWIGSIMGLLVGIISGVMSGMILPYIMTIPDLAWAAILLLPLLGLLAVLFSWIGIILGSIIAGISSLYIALKSDFLSILLVIPLALYPPIYIRSCSEDKILFNLVRIASYICIILSIFVFLIGVTLALNEHVRGGIFCLLVGLCGFHLGKKMRPSGGTPDLS